jgi:SAM-dependent methyltransferase
VDKYLENSKRFGWGELGEPLNPEKTTLLDKYTKDKVLDVGCASGRYTNYLFSKGFDVCGIDTQPDLIKMAKKEYPKIPFKVAPAEKIPFADNSFDTIILFDILEHLADDVLALREARRVGRRVIISVPRENQDFLTDHSLAHHHYLDRTHLRTYTPGSLRKLLIKAGFKVVTCHEALPISVYSLTVDHFSQGSRLKELVIRAFLKLLGMEKQLYSTVFAVCDRG